MYGDRMVSANPVLDAVGEPNRRHLLELLHASTEATVSELVLASGMRQPQVSKHLKVLAGAVVRRRCGRTAAIADTASTGEASRAAHDWFASFEDVWQARFDALDAARLR